MTETTALTGWTNFFVILGSSAGALIGLQFVVVALLADIPHSAGEQQEQAGSAFGTPTIVHFSTVLLLSAVLSAPWHNLRGPVTLVALIALFGLVYSLVVTGRMRRQTLYQPVLEDWLFHSCFPLGAHAILIGSAYAASVNARGSIFGIGAAALLLLFTGIHNAWDAASYHVFVARHRKRDPGELTSPKSERN